MRGSNRERMASSLPKSCPWPRSPLHDAWHCFSSHSMRCCCSLVAQPCDPICFPCKPSSLRTTAALRRRCYRSCAASHCCRRSYCMRCEMSMVKRWPSCTLFAPHTSVGSCCPPRWASCCGCYPSSRRGCLRCSRRSLASRSHYGARSSSLDGACISASSHRCGTSTTCARQR